VVWGVFAAFVALAMLFNRPEALFAGRGPLAAGKLLVWAAFLGFTAYSFYCSLHEDLIATIRKIAKLHWGRQIGIDLYIGLSLALFVIYLNEGSLLVVLLWLVPMLVFANQATLLYFALHYDSIVAKLAAGSVG
jgi:hypothetical protein